MTKRILAKLETAVGKTHACLEKRDAPGVLLANYEFHSAIYQSSDNSALALSIDRLYVQTGPWLAHGIENLVNAENWLGEHELIIEALRNSDAKTARKLMEEDAFWSVELYRRMG